MIAISAKNIFVTPIDHETFSVLCIDPSVETIDNIKNTVITDEVTIELMDDHAGHFTNYGYFSYDRPVTISKIYHSPTRSSLQFITKRIPINIVKDHVTKDNVKTIEIEAEAIHVVDIGGSCLTFICFNPTRKSVKAITHELFATEKVTIELRDKNGHFANDRIVQVIDSMYSDNMNSLRFTTQTRNLN